MNDPQQLKRNNLLLHHQLNLAAGRLLPPGWKNPLVMPVISLMQWGLQDGEVELEVLSADQPSKETLENFVQHLAQANPNRVMSLLTSPLNGQDQLLADNALNQVKSPKEGARLLLEALHEALVATAE